MSDLPEADWKYMRALKSTLLERLCERINRENAGLLNDSSRTAYERYLAVYEKMRKDDKKVASAFDDWRRSTLLFRIWDIHRQGLFTDSEVQGLTQETQELVNRFRNL
jgi:hypothetical protein